MRSLHPITIEIITANLPVNMHPADKEQYIKAHSEIIEIESTGLNKHMLEPLRNYAFNIIRPYVLDPSYKG